MEYSQIPDHKKKSVQITEQLFDLIKNGEIQPGERLPSERELAAQLNVSRTVVREARGTASSISKKPA